MSKSILMLLPPLTWRMLQVQLGHMHGKGGKTKVLSKGKSKWKEKVKGVTNLNVDN
jgi:hypothetical protein